MAAKTLYFKNAAASGANHLSLQDGGTAPTGGGTGTGWTVGTVAVANYSLQNAGTVRASATFNGTPAPSAAPSNAVGDCWRSENTLQGTFAAGDWVITVSIAAQNTSNVHDGKPRLRVWRSSNADGSGATEITAATQVGTECVNIVAGNTRTSTITWTAPQFTLDGEYLFYQMAWEITGAGAASTDNLIFCVGAAGIFNSKTTTTDFTAEILLAAAAAAVATATADLETEITMAADAAAEATATADLETEITMAADAAAVATASGTLSDYIVPTIPEHIEREYEEYLRGPVGAPAFFFGTRNARRGGEPHLHRISKWTVPGDGEMDEFGIQSGAGFTVELFDVDTAAVGSALRNQVCELELVTRLHFADGTTQELTHVRRAKCKKVVRKQNILALTFATIDKDGLKQIFPFDKWTVEDCPNLFPADVAKRIVQGVGRAAKVPMILIEASLGNYVYGGPRVLAAPGTCAAVYRGTRPGEGGVVPAAEYTVDTMVLPDSGIEVHTLTFVNEQLDLHNNPYVIEADWDLPGTRTASSELKRLLPLAGYTVNDGAFEIASANDIVAGILIDPCYGADNNQQGRDLNSIIELLLMCARGWLVDQEDGSISIVQDVIKAPSWSFDTRSDLFEMQDYGDGERPSKVTMKCQPHSVADDKFALVFSRATEGNGSEKVISMPYLRSFDAADRLACYWEKRINANSVGNGALHGLQLTSGEVIIVNDPLHFDGDQTLLVVGNSRPADRNELTLRRYDPAIYGYTAGTPPEGATSGYETDYTFTPPDAPTGGTVQANTTSVDATGKAFATVTLRATRPASNVSHLIAAITNEATNAVTLNKMAYVGPYDEVIVGGLAPTQDHNVLFYAVNVNDIDGATQRVDFTAATFADAPPTPTGLAIAQIGKAFSVRCTTPTYAHHDAVVWERKTGAGGTYAAITGSYTSELTDSGVAYGNTYYYRCRFRDLSGNYSSSYSSEVSLTMAANFNNSDIIPSGIGTASLANSAVNRDKQYTNYATFSASVPASGFASLLLAEFIYALDQRSLQGSRLCTHSLVKSWSDNGRTSQGYKDEFGLGDTVFGEYRNVQA